MRKITDRCPLLLAVLLPCTAVEAHDLTQNLSLDGVFSAALQCQNLSDNTNADDTCKSAIPFQPSLTYRAASHSTLYLKLGFASGNGLNEVSPFIIPPWAADLENDVENINGSGRDHLLEAWYQHMFDFEQANRVGITLGVIDASQYLDQNAYANDEFTQFMNPALSNAPNTFFPSYDPGVAAEWLSDQWTFTGVYMRVHQNTRTDKYDFYGVQAGYRLDSVLGTGNYRILLNSDRNLIDQTGMTRQKNDLLIFSIDQQFGDNIGAFSRLGWRLDDSRIDFRAIYSGGIDISGETWGRLLDNIGLGVAYLEGSNGNINSSRIAEGYYRMVLSAYLSLTADIQYTHDTFIQTSGIKGTVYSLRATVIF